MGHKSSKKHKRATDTSSHLWRERIWFIYTGEILPESLLRSLDVVLHNKGVIGNIEFTQLILQPDIIPEATLSKLYAYTDQQQDHLRYLMRLILIRYGIRSERDLDYLLECENPIINTLTIYYFGETLRSIRSELIRTYRSQYLTYYK